MLTGKKLRSTRCCHCERSEAILPLMKGLLLVTLNLFQGLVFEASIPDADAPNRRTTWRHTVHISKPYSRQR